MFFLVMSAILIDIQYSGNICDIRSDMLRLIEAYEEGLKLCDILIQKYSRDFFDFSYKKIYSLMFDYQFCQQQQSQQKYDLLLAELENQIKTFSDQFCLINIFQLLCQSNQVNDKCIKKIIDICLSAKKDCYKAALNIILKQVQIYSKGIKDHILFYNCRQIFYEMYSFIKFFVGQDKNELFTIVFEINEQLFQRQDIILRQSLHYSLIMRNRSEMFEKGLGVQQNIQLAVESINRELNMQKGNENYYAYANYVAAKLKRKLQNQYPEQQSFQSLLKYIQILNFNYKQSSFYFQQNKQLQSQSILKFAKEENSLKQFMILNNLIKIFLTNRQQVNQHFEKSWSQFSQRLNDPQETNNTKLVYLYYLSRLSKIWKQNLQDCQRGFAEALQLYQNEKQTYQVAKTFQFEILCIKIKRKTNSLGQASLYYKNGGISPNGQQAPFTNGSQGDRQLIDNMSVPNLMQNSVGQNQNIFLKQQQQLQQSQGSQNGKIHNLDNQITLAGSKAYGFQSFKTGIGNNISPSNSNNHMNNNMNNLNKTNNINNMNNMSNVNNNMNNMSNINNFSNMNNLSNPNNLNSLNILNNSYSENIQTYLTPQNSSKSMGNQINFINSNHNSLQFNNGNYFSAVKKQGNQNISGNDSFYSKLLSSGNPNHIIDRAMQDKLNQLKQKRTFYDPNEVIILDFLHRGARYTTSEAVIINQNKNLSMDNQTNTSLLGDISLISADKLSKMRSYKKHMNISFDDQQVLEGEPVVVKQFIISDPRLIDDMFIFIEAQEKKLLNKQSTNNQLSLAANNNSLAQKQLQQVFFQQYLINVKGFSYQAISNDTIALYLFYPAQSYNLYGALKKNFSLLDKLLIAQQICDCINNLHASSIFQLNLKPSNILFDNKKIPYLSGWEIKRRDIVQNQEENIDEEDFDENFQVNHGYTAPEITNNQQNMIYSPAIANSYHSNQFATPTKNITQYSTNTFSNQNQFKVLNTNQDQYQINNRSDVWSLGMILFYLFFNIDPGEGNFCRDKRIYTGFNLIITEYAIGSNYFLDKIKEVIEDMVKYNPEERIAISQAKDHFQRLYIDLDAQIKQNNTENLNYKTSGIPHTPNGNNYIQYQSANNQSYNHSTGMQSQNNLSYNLNNQSYHNYEQQGGYHLPQRYGGIQQQPQNIYNNNNYNNKIQYQNNNFNSSISNKSNVFC